MIIDCRIRPPMGTFVKANLYRPQVTQPWANNFNMTIPESVVKRDPELMFKEMDEAGVDMGVITGRQSGVHGRIPNEEIMDIVRKYPTRFVGVAGIDGNWETSHAIEEIEKTCINGNLRGVGLEPGVCDEPLHTDDKHLYPIYEYCQAHDLPVFIMGGGGQGPDVTYSMPHHIQHVCTDFPKLTVVDTHAGYPWVDQTLFVCMMCPNLYLAPDMYTYTVPGSQSWVNGANYMIPDRFFFGTAYPFIGFKDGLKAFRSMGFREDLMDNFLCRNVARVLKIDVR